MLSDQQGDYVSVVDAQKKAQVRRIQQGRSTPSTAVITNGLNQGELVISEGLQRVRDGEAVTPQPETPGPQVHSRAGETGGGAPPTTGASRTQRAVMMTPFAFILGVYPLVVAQGASEISRHGVGTPVFAGMIASSAIGVFVIPMLYVTFQMLRERGSTILASIPKPIELVRGFLRLRAGKQDSRPPTS